MLARLYDIRQRTVRHKTIASEVLPTGSSDLHRTIGKAVLIF